ncbi:MAG: 50S ribosomal protein L25/general stress protein Ctc [Deltaproteobacteria bacterium]|nr:50S ribosomal protein L25/general stress protein Ctc [Deltaproteobacteria bacterium]
MDILDIKANIRKTTGKGSARVLRRDGWIPAILYGAGKDPVMLSVERLEFEAITRNQSIANVLLNLSIKNGKTTKQTVMIKEMQVHPVSLDYLHLDFYEVAMDQKIRVDVPVVTVGQSVGVELGGILQIVRREIEVLCLPLNIPESFEVDITNLDVGDSLHVSDLPLGDGVEIVPDANLTVVTVVMPKMEIEPEEEVEEGEEEAEEGAEAEAADDETGTEE